MTPEVTDLWARDIIIFFFEQELQHIVCAKNITERKKNDTFQHISAFIFYFYFIFFFWQRQIQKIKVLKCYAEKDKTIF